MNSRLNSTVIVIFFVICLLSIGVAVSGQNVTGAAPNGTAAPDSGGGSSGPSTITCYVCNSFTNKTCGSLSDKKAYEKSCKGGYNGCRKIIQTFVHPATKNNEERTIRQCAKKAKNDCNPNADRYIKSATCVCDTSLCNFSPKVEVPNVLILITIISFLLV